MCWLYDGASDSVTGHVKAQDDKECFSSDQNCSVFFNPLTNETDWKVAVNAQFLKFNKWKDQSLA